MRTLGNSVDPCSFNKGEFHINMQAKPPWAGKICSQVQIIDINQVIAGSIELVAFESRESRTTVETELADHLPEVLADRIQIEQVVVNLLHNAHEALRRVDPPRHVVVRSIDAKSEVEIQVQDSGPGIPFAHYAKLFEAFHTTKKNGLGMGLTISRTIIEDHGGRLWAQNNSDAGVTFHFSLPTVRTGGGPVEGVMGDD